MLDIKFIRDNLELVKTNSQNKGIIIDFNQLLNLDENRRRLIQETEALQAAQNAANEAISQAKGSDKKAQIAKMKKIAIEIDLLKPQLKELENKFEELMMMVPQIADPKTPVGPDSSFNRIEETYGEIPKFDFDVKSHVDLAKTLDIVDFERGVKVLGNRGYYLKNEGTLLEKALMNYGLDFMVSRGFTPMSVPVMAPDQFFWGTGHFPWGREEIFKVYERTEHTYNLVGSSEVTLCAYHANEILDEKSLPIRLTAWSPCFRTEVGSYGKDTKGLYRLKQFYKVEQVVLCAADSKEGEKRLMEILKNSKDFLKSLEIPFQVVRNATGDMGAGKISMFDIESWMPSRKGYGETHSCSYLGDWQARRLKIRYKDKNGKINFVHTLNNTLIASPRILIPLLELNQKADGSVTIPGILRPYLNGVTVIRPKK